MKNILVALVVFFSFSCSAEEFAPDIKIDRNSVIINRVSTGVLEELQRFDKKETGKIIFTANVTQAGFNTVIKNNRWIRHIRAESWNKNIYNIAVVAQLPSLVTLELPSLEESKRTPVDLAPLASLTHLIEINFNATHVVNTNALSGLVNLESINFHMSNVDSIDFLKNTPNVKKLILSGSDHKFKDYSPLANLKQLGVLDLNLNPQATDTNLAVLKNINSLTDITIYRSDITHLNFLKTHKGLRKVYIMGCGQLTDISVLKDMNFLTELDIDGAPVEQLDVLKGKNQLELLSISETRVKNIAVLGDLPGLRRIHLLNTEISDISPLFKLTDVLYVHFGDKVPSAQIEAFKKKFPNS